MRARTTIAAAALAFMASSAAAQALLETTWTLGKQPAAVVVEFQAAAAGNYRITLTDFGTATGPLRMSRVDAAVVRGSELVTSATVTSSLAGGTASKTFAAAAGTHRLIFIGQPAAGARVGSAGVRIDDPVSGAVLLDAVEVFTVPPPPTASPADFEHEFAVPAGSYTLTTTDFALPQALGVLHTTVVRRSDGAVLAFMLPPSTAIALTAGTADTFEVFVHAELASGATRGLLGLNLRDTANGTTHAAEIHELGAWPYRFDFDVASAATLTATLADLQFPAPLTTLAAQTARDGQAIGGRLTASTGTSFAATAGSYRLYVDAVPSASPGSFGITVAPPAPAALVLEEVQNVVPVGPVTDLGALDTFFDVTTAGNYTLTLTDFGASGFFDAFASIELALTRDNQLVGSRTAPGSIAFAATPGRYGIAIVADPAGNAGEGLLGVRVRGGPADAIVFDRTEAVGSDFVAATVDVAIAQSVDVRLTDVGFPATFASLRVAVTRGAERVGEIVGAGTFSFQAVPGTYIVNLLAVPSAAVGYGTLGLRAAATPPPPVITLAASAGSVTVGASVTLTWNAQNADACTASGGWTGSRPMSGSASSGPVNASTTFTLTCTGVGGSRDAAVTVAAAAAQRSGGGGAIDPWFLLALAAAALAIQRRRRVPASLRRAS
jgi:hypothetical protein